MITNARNKPSLAAFNLSLNAASGSDQRESQLASSRFMKYKTSNMIGLAWIGLPDGIGKYKNSIKLNQS